mmetsp:Transcript_10017/g.28172  ORF Transcript_10017/g.28172 Transcript_10017/m.28172 type:complete len:461 (-) Transcript_10017:591-1973(-)
MFQQMQNLERRIISNVVTFYLLLFTFFAVRKCICNSLPNVLVPDEYSGFGWRKFWNRTFTYSSECGDANDCYRPCDEGPYLLSVSNYERPEGLGSALQRRRVGPILSTTLGLNWIPTFFSMTEHNTSQILGRSGPLQILGLCNEVQSCNLCSLYNRWATSALDAIYIGKAFVTRQVALAMCEKKYEEKLKIATKDGLSTNDSFKLAKARKISLEKSLAPVLHAQINGNASVSSLFILEEVSRIESPYCSMDYVASAYAKYYHIRSSLGRAYVLPSGVINVAIFFRLGDVGDLDTRNIHEETALNLLGLVYQTLPASLLRLHVVAEGTMERPFLKRFHERRREFLPASDDTMAYHIEGGPTNVQRDLDILATADIFISAQSSFSSLGAMLNRRGILFVPDRSEKYDQWTKYKTSQCVLQYQRYDLSGNVSKLEKQLQTCILRHPNIRRVLTKARAKHSAFK